MQRKRRLLWPVLLAAAWFGAAAGRNLAQAPPPAAADGAAAAAPAPEPSAEPAALESRYGGPRIDACIELTNRASASCSVESDTMSLVYPRGSEEPPTQQEIDTAIANMKAAAQPSSACCEDLVPYSDSRCVCDPEYQVLLPIGGFSTSYFEGATRILAQACGAPDPPCNPAGEVSNPVVSPSSGR